MELRFLITGAWDAGHAFALESTADLPDGSRLAVQIPNGSAGACSRNALIWTSTTLRMPATGKAVIAWCAYASIPTAVMCSARSTCPPVPLPSATSRSTFPLSGASEPSVSRSASYTRIAR